MRKKTYLPFKSIIILITREGNTTTGKEEDSGMGACFFLLSEALDASRTQGFETALLKRREDQARWYPGRSLQGMRIEKSPAVCEVQTCTAKHVCPHLPSSGMHPAG